MHVGKTVSVLVSFTLQGNITPLRFQWAGRLIRVQEVTYRWKSRNGTKEIHHFSVTDGSTLYELTFDSISLVWRLENLEA